MGKKKKKLEGDDLMNIVVEIPKNAVHLKMIATIVDRKGNTQKARRVFSADDIHEKRQDFVDLIGDDYADTYFLTEEGKQLGKLDKLQEDEVGM